MNEYKGQELPWYLKRMPFLVIAFCFAPAAYLLVFLNWNRLNAETKGERFFASSLLMLIFSIGFMPRNYLSISLAIGIFLFINATTFAVLARKK